MHISLCKVRSDLKTRWWAYLCLVMGKQSSLLLVILSFPFSILLTNLLGKKLLNFLHYKMCPLFHSIFCDAVLFLSFWALLFFYVSLYSHGRPISTLFTHDTRIDLTLPLQNQVLRSDVNLIHFEVPNVFNKRSNQTYSLDLLSCRLRYWYLLTTFN